MNTVRIRYEKFNSGSIPKKDKTNMMGTAIFSKSIGAMCGTATTGGGDRPRVRKKAGIRCPCFGKPGRAGAVMQKRKELYGSKRKEHPERWADGIRFRELPDEVAPNPTDTYREENRKRPEGTFMPRKSLGNEYAAC